MKNYVLLLVLVILFSSCRSITNLFTSRGEKSQATGWKINDPSNGGFSLATSYGAAQTPPGMIFIEGGSFTMGGVQDDIMYDWNATPTTLHVRSFYMDQTEVTNAMYLEYLYWLKRVFPPHEKEEYRIIYESALPDTLVWRNTLGALDALVETYLRHPAFRDYPVVGVSWIQAQRYCDWRTDRVNEQILIERGILNQVNGSDDRIVEGENHFNTRVYLTDPSLVFKDKDNDVYRKGLPDNSPGQKVKGGFKGRHARMEDGILFPRYRLPTEAEWEYAATASIGTMEKNMIKGRRVYPWQGVTPVKQKKNANVKYLANYKGSTGNYAGIAHSPTDSGDITTAVRSYPANEYGLYDMAGNVAEWVADVYRPRVDEKGNDFNYYRGNIYMKNMVDSDGKIIKISSQEIPYDTLSNGRIVPRQIPGEILSTPITAQDTYMRFNYSTSDNRNIGDGDHASSRHFADASSASLTGSSLMYNAPQNPIVVDSSGRVSSIYDDSRRTSLINDRVRVYKGGSWRDRLYWLSPSERRYLQEDFATDFIGFRCAMDYVGDSYPKKGKNSSPLAKSKGLFSKR